MGKAWNVEWLHLKVIHERTHLYVVVVVLHYLIKNRCMHARFSTQGSPTLVCWNFWIHQLMHIIYSAAGVKATLIVLT